MKISREDSDRQYLENLLDELESNPFNQYEMRVIEQKENGDYTHIAITIDRNDIEERTRR